MAAWLKKGDDKRFGGALLEAMKCKPTKPRPRSERDKYKFSPAGLHRLTIYLSPQELKAARAIADEHNISVTMVIRSLLRLYQQIPIDTPEVKEKKKP